MLKRSRHTASFCHKQKLYFEVQNYCDTSMFVLFNSYFQIAFLNMVLAALVVCYLSKEGVFDMLTYFN